MDITEDQYTSSNLEMSLTTTLEGQETTSQGNANMVSIIGDPSTTVMDENTHIDNNMTPTVDGEANVETTDSNVETTYYNLETTDSNLETTDSNLETTDATTHGIDMKHKNHTMFLGIM